MRDAKRIALPKLEPLFQTLLTVLNVVYDLDTVTLAIACTLILSNKTLCVRLKNSDNFDRVNHYV